MKAFILILSLFLFFGGVIRAQQQEPPMITIKGKLVDHETRTSLPYGSVFLKSEPEMELVKGVAADENGNFILRVPKATYWIVVSYVGYSTMMYGVTGDKDFGEVAILPADNMLGPVTVKPLVEQSVDKIVYNITSDPERDKLSVSEILKKVPMIRELPNGNIYIDSPDKKFLVVRNGKVDALFSGNVQDVLKNLPAKGFATVRLLLAPPERYGECDYILDIVTDETTRLIGAVGSTYGSYRTLDNTIELKPEVTFSGDKIRGLVTAGGMTSDPAKQRSTTEQTFFKNAQQIKRKDVASQSFKRGNVKGTFSFDVRKNHFISFMADYNYSELKSHRTQISETYDESQLTRLYHSQTSERTLTPALNTSFDYQIDFAKPDRILNISWLYAGKPAQTKHDIQTEEQPSTELQQLRDKNKNETYEHVVQLNYTDQLTKELNMEVGAKYTNRNYQIENEYDQQLQSIWEPQPERHLLMDKQYNIIMGYAKLSYTLKQLRISAFANGEYLDDGRGTRMLTGNKTGFIQEDGFVFYPKLELYYKSKKIRIDFNYRWNMNRPGLTFLNPMVSDPNADVISIGNPNLDAERNHFYRFSIAFGKKISHSFGIVGSNSNNAISSYWFKDEQNRSVRTYRNYGSRHSIMFQYRMTYVSPKWFVMGYSSYEYAYKRTDEDEEQNAHSVQLSMNISYRFKSGWSLMAIPAYIYTYTDGQEGSSRNPVSFGMGVNKKFLKDKLDVSAGLGNLLQIDTETTTKVTTPDFRMKTKTTSGCYSASLSLSYRFGSFQVKPVRQAKSRAAITDIKTEE